MTIEGDYETPYDYSLHYRLDGTGPEKIFLVIGFCSSRAYWGPLVDAIHSKYAGRYTTCIYDQRGVGQSTTRITEKCSTVTLARDIAGMLLHLGWIGKQIPLHLIAWSMGGFASIEFVDMLLTQVGGTLNISSLTLCNTGHKMVLPAAGSLIPGARMIGKGIMSFIFGISTAWLIPEILRLHYSPDYLSDPNVYSALANSYTSRPPFDSPMRNTTVAILQHLYAVTTHYVSRKRIARIKKCGLPIHVVVSSEDVLIHPTASITLARLLGTQFSYLPGGHMSHVEHTDVVLDKLVALWDEGLSRKYPYYRKSSPTGNNLPRTLSVNLTSDPNTQLSSMRNRVAGSNDWVEADVIMKLNKVVTGRMDSWSVSSIVKRMRQPGRLVILPALLLPIILIQLRKIRNAKNSRKDRALEAGLLVYVLGLVAVVQEVTRQDG